MLTQRRLGDDQIGKLQVVTELMRLPVQQILFVVDDGLIDGAVCSIITEFRLALLARVHRVCG